RLGVAADDAAGGAEHVLGTQLVGELEGLAGAVGVEDELDDSGAVAKVDEDQAAVVAAAVGPAGDPRLGGDPVRQDLAAPGVAVGVGRQRRRAGHSLAHASPPVISSTRLPVSTARCSPLCMSRSCALPSASRISTCRAPTRSACLSWPFSPRPARSTSA